MTPEWSTREWTRKSIEEACRQYYLKKYGKKAYKFDWILFSDSNIYAGQNMSLCNDGGRVRFRESVVGSDNVLINKNQQFSTLPTDSLMCGMYPIFTLQTNGKTFSLSNLEEDHEKWYSRVESVTFGYEGKSFTVPMLVVYIKKSQCEELANAYRIYLEDTYFDHAFADKYGDDMTIVTTGIRTSHNAVGDYGETVESASLKYVKVNDGTYDRLNNDEYNCEYVCNATLARNDNIGCVSPLRMNINSEPRIDNRKIRTEIQVDFRKFSGYNNSSIYCVGNPRSCITDFDYTPGMTRYGDYTEVRWNTITSPYFSYTRSSGYAQLDAPFNGLKADSAGTFNVNMHVHQHDYTY